MTSICHEEEVFFLTMEISHDIPQHRQQDKYNTDILALSYQSDNREEPTLFLSGHLPVSSLIKRVSNQ